jgi:hypothetical protein
MSKNCFTVANFKDIELVKEASDIDGRSIGGFIKYYSVIVAKDIINKNNEAKNES